MVLNTDNEMLFICNRLNLKRQVKIDVARLQGIKINENDFETLDKMSTFGKITIMSYHTIQNKMVEHKYNKNANIYDYSNFNYIVMDECHYILQDATFNNKTVFFQDYIKNYNKIAIRIHISATMEDVKELLKDIYKKENVSQHIKEYTTGIDYSYVKPFYFNNLKSIANKIVKDESNKKWLIFVSKVEDATKIMETEELRDKCKFICSENSNNSDLMDKKELQNIINNSKFNCKVLICTKAMDNGINFKDEKLTNIVVMAWDRIEFIQMLGRKRINVEDAQDVNLYIPKKYKKSFVSLLDNKYNSSKQAVELYYKDYNKFCKKYDTSLNKLGKLSELFYRDPETKEFVINKAGEKILNNNIDFCEKMINKFEYDKNAFIKEQLSWIGLKDSFNEENFLEDIEVQENKNELLDYLEKNIGDKKFKFNKEYAKAMDFFKTCIITKYGSLKIKTINSFLETNNYPYLVRTEQESKGKNRKKTYLIILKLTDKNNCA